MGRRELIVRPHTARLARAAGAFSPGLTHRSQAAATMLTCSGRGVAMHGRGGAHRHDPLASGHHILRVARGRSRLSQHSSLHAQSAIICMHGPHATVLCNEQALETQVARDRASSRGAEWSAPRR